jgi:DNA-binding XRE family transcriptional regulator
LQGARIRQQLSQAAVAERVGTTTQNVSRWERGVTRPNPYYRDKLCKFFGKDPWELDLDVAPGSFGSLPTRDRIFDPVIPAHPPRPFVGRVHELATIKTRLCAGAKGLVVALHGLPGVGKTTLAWAIAYSTHIHQYFEDGVMWVTLGPNPDLLLLLSRWGALLRIPETTLEGIGNLQQWMGTLNNAIGTRRMLLVIDDVWSSVDADVFRVGGPHCTHLVTTRFRSVAAITATPPVMPVTIRELADAESLVLLQRLAPETRGCAASMLRTFVQSVGGLPLALKQAGSYLHRTASMVGSDAIPVSIQRLSEPHAFSESEALAAAHCSLGALDELLDAGVLEPCLQDSYALHAVIAAYARVFLAQER